MTHLIENVNLESSSSDCSYCSMNCYASCNDSCNYRCFGGSGDD